MKLIRTKAKLDAEGLTLAQYIVNNFDSLKRVQIQTVVPKKNVTQKTNEYLRNNAHRAQENQLLGIVAVKDVWKNATGGRVHLVIGMRGPLVESLHSSVLSSPVDYELKNRIILNSIQEASTAAIPKAGNIHCHPWLCTEKSVTVAELFEYIRNEHGHQNDVQQSADATIQLFMNTHEPYWRPINQETLRKVFRIK